MITMKVTVFDDVRCVDFEYPLFTHLNQPMMRPQPNWKELFLWLMSEQRARVKGSGSSFFSMTDLTV